MDATRLSLARRILLTGGAASVFLFAASILSVFSAPLAVLTLISSVLTAGILLRRWGLVIAASIGGLALISAAIVWWVTWGQAFNYADVNQPVPGALDVLQLGSGIAAAIAGIVLTGVWVWLIASSLSRPHTAVSAS